MKKILYIGLFLFCSCSKSPHLEGFDTKAWNEDKKACQNVRSELIGTLFQQRDALLGCSEADIIAYLGKPDAQDLDERNVKYLYYYYLPGLQCQSEDQKGAKYIRMRLNSISLVSEIIKL